MVNNTKTNFSKMKFVEIFNIWNYAFKDIYTPMEIQNPKLSQIHSVKHMLNNISYYK